MQLEGGVQREVVREGLGKREWRTVGPRWSPICACLTRALRLADLMACGCSVAREMSTLKLRRLFCTLSEPNWMGSSNVSDTAESM